MVPETTIARRYKSSMPTMLPGSLGFGHKTDGLILLVLSRTRPIRQ